MVRETVPSINQPVSEIILAQIILCSTFILFKHIASGCRTVHSSHPRCYVGIIFTGENLVHFYHISSDLSVIKCNVGSLHTITTLTTLIEANVLGGLA